MSLKANRPKASLSVKLPNKIIHIPNPDKKFHEKWNKNRNMLNIPHPFRALCFGPPNVGKTTVVKNILIRAKPKFKQVYVIHCDGNYTKEYDDLGDGMEMLDEIPAPNEWEGIDKTLVVIDDLELKSLNKIQKRNLDRLFGYCSTHKNISIILNSQDAFNIPPIVRRCSNMFVLWRSNDMDSMYNICRRSGIRKKMFLELFENVIVNYHDSLWLDSTVNTPYPIRKNGFEIIKKKKMINK